MPTNLNLNRDYMKADAARNACVAGRLEPVEAGSIHRSSRHGRRRFSIQRHLRIRSFSGAPPSIKNWMDEHFDGVVVPNVEKEGNLLTHYVEFAGREVTGGIATFIATPRFATGYTPLRNRAGLLVETHVYKPYKSRVRGTYDILRYTIEEVNRSKASLFLANIAADTQTVERGKTYDPTRKFPLSVGVTDRSVPFAFKGVEYKMEDSPISGGKRIVYGHRSAEYHDPAV